MTYLKSSIISFLKQILLSLFLLSAPAFFNVGELLSQTYRIDTLDGQVVYTCSGTFYDSGADIGNYSNGEYYTVTFSSSLPGQRITFDFTSFDLRNEGGDTLKIYDGPNATYPLVGEYTGEGLAFTVQSTDTCLTVRFTSDASLVNSGWEATISCCPVPSTSAITGSAIECIGSAGVPYSVVNTPGSSYNWIITGGIQAGGGNGNAITVDWGSTAGAAKVQVVEDNGCTTGDTIELNVTLLSLPTVSFSGLNANYDITLDGSSILSGAPSGGTFTGPGISGNVFDPAAAGLGAHEIVYSYTDGNGCTNTDTNFTTVTDYDHYTGARLLSDMDNWCSADAQYSNASATADMSAGSCWSGGTGNNVWFRFVATTNAVNVDVMTGGTYGTMRGQQIAIWNDLNQQVACINAADWYAGTLSLSMDTLTAGHTYWISVDDRRTHGTFTLCIDDEADYDFKSGAIELTDITSWCSADAAYANTYATPDESAGSCWSGGSANNVWFKFTATTQSITVDVITGGTYGSMRGQQIALWNESGTEVKCINAADWYAGTLTLSIDTLTIGNEYWISVDDRRTHGTFSLCIDNTVSYDYKSGALTIDNIDNYTSADAAYDNVYATADQSAGSCWSGGVGNNVWFKFVASSTTVQISVITGGTKGTMRGQQIALWTESGTEVKCVNAADWFAGTLTMEIDTLTLGNTYYISVDDRRTHGTFTLEIDDEVGFDYKAGAELLLDLDNWCSADAIYDNVYATADQSAGSCWSGGTGNNVWFRFVAISGEIQIDVKTGGTFGTMRGQQIALWNVDGIEVGCVNGADWFAGTLSLSADTLTPGNNYYISVDDRRTHGTFTICVNNKAGFDFKAGAILISPLGDWCSNDAAYNNTYATADESAGSCWSGGTGNNVWFKFVAPTTAVTIDVITGGSYGTMRGQQIALWNENNDEVGCVNAADWYAGTLSLSIDTLTPGHTYHISVDDRRTHGTFTICVDYEQNYDFKSGAYEITSINNWCSADAEFSNTYATADETAGSCWSGGTGNNVWFKFNALTNAVQVDAITGGSYGTMRGQQIALWNGDGTEVGCINAADWYAGTLTLSIDTLTPGTDYWISVDDRRTHGTFTLCVDAVVSNDYKSGALELTDLVNWCSSDAVYNNTYATADESAGSCWSGGTGNNLWYYFVATTGSIQIDVKTGGSYGTMRGQQIALWNGNDDEVGCANAADWYAGTLTLSVDTLTVGNTYYISVDDRRTHGTFTLCVNNDPGYDYKSGAIELTDLENWQSADAAYINTYATPDESAGSCWTGGTANNVWFKFEALFDTLTVDVITGGASGTMRGQQIAVWTEDGTEAGCVNAIDWFAGTLSLQVDTLTPGNTYYISVDDRRTHGTFTLAVDNTSNVEYWAIANGDWNNPTTWSHSEGGPPASTYPTKESIVHIKGYTVTVVGTESAAIYLEVENANTSLVIDADTLNVHGSVTFINNGNDYDGTIIVQNSGGLNIDDDFTINRAGGANIFSVTVNDNSFINIGNDLNLISSGGTVFENQFTLNNSSTLQVDRDINFANSGGQKLNLQLNNTTALTALRDINIAATAQDQAEVELNGNAVLNISGDFTRGATAYGILDCNDNATINFNSSLYLQIIPENTGAGTDGVTYQNITIDNSRITLPQLSLEGPVSVPGTLTLTDGVVQTTATNLLTLEDGATASGGSAASYISGPLEKIGNDAFTFPIGKDGYYKPLTISAPSNNTDGFSAEYFYDDPDNNYDVTLKEGTIDHIAGWEYWEVDRTAGASNVDVTIGWDGTTGCINDLAQLKVVSWDGAQWIDLGNGGTTGNLSAGTITSSSNISNNSNPVTFGDPLPIVSFSGLAGPYCESAASVLLTGSPQDANGTFTGEGISDNGDGTATFDPSAAAYGTHEITYTYDNVATGCTGDYNEDVTVIRLPSATLNGTTTMCEGSSTTLSAFFIGQADWTFKYTNTTDTTEVTTSLNPYTFVVNDTGNYRIIELTDNSGCPGTDFGSSAYVGYYPVIPAPTIDTVGTTPFCDDDSLLLISSGGGSFSLWSNGETTDTINVTSSGNYYVQIVDANLCVSESSDTVTVIVQRIPRKPSAISGPASVCQDAANTEYTTYSQYASNYIWELFPVAAGTISGTGTTGTVDWDAGFTGAAQIVVKGNNVDCGDGEASDTLSISVTAYPTQAGQPSGTDTMLIDPPDTDYLTSGATGATSYQWAIDPVAAGSISGTGTTGTVAWDNAWTGTAFINVRGINSCGTGPWSDTLPVLVMNPPSVTFTEGATMSGLESISPVMFVVELSAASPVDISFDFATSDGTATLADNDYADTTGTFVVPAGKTRDTLIVYVNEDGVEESNETFNLTLSNFTNCIAGANIIITYTILDNDGLGYTGPGGVGNLSDQVNVWLNSYYISNLSDGSDVSTNPNQWDGISDNDVDAYQNVSGNEPVFYDVSPTWNGRPLIRFNSANNEYLKIADNQWMNNPPGAQSKRTIIVSFRTGTDITTRQVIFEEGGGARGLNVYIQDDTLYIGGWNYPNDDATTPWPYTSVKAEISTNTPYFAILQFDFDGVSGEVRGSLNGVDLGALAGAGRLFRHTGDIGLGAMNQGACYDDGSCPGGTNYYFDGFIAELISGNIVYNDAELKIVHNYLAAKYAITLPAGDDLYDYEVNNGYELFGIGQVDADNFHNFAQGKGIIRIQNPSDIGNDKFMLMGHDDGDISAWVNTEIPNNDANIVRVAREWRVDKQGGDIGTVDMIIDSTQFGSYFSSYSAFVLLIDDDGDFTSGSRSIQLTNSGSGTYTISDVDFTKGEFFTIARVRPAIEFQLTSSDGDETIGTVDITIRMNYASSSDVTVDYASANGTADYTQVPIGDYDQLTGTFTLTAGDTSGIITLTINNDVVVESDENLTITLSNPSAGTYLGTNTVHTFTIHDDDNTRKVQFTLQDSEGSEITSPVTVELHLTTDNPGSTVEVDYNVLAGGTATGGGTDYDVITSGTISFPISDTLENIPSITINDDALDEADETILIELSNPVNANLGDTTIHTYTIRDNDPTPEANFDVTALSGAESYSPIQLVVRLSAASGSDIDVDYAVTGGTALGGGIDFTLTDGTLTIPAGIDSAYFLLDIFNDIVEESNEDIEITLRNPVNAVLGNDTIMTYTIIDDDGLGWHGPGGVGNFDSQINAWMRSTDPGVLTDGTPLSTAPNHWEDQTGTGNHAFQTVAANQPVFYDVSPTWNNRPVIEFDRAGNQFLDIADNVYMNTFNGGQTKRTIIVSFRPADNITDRQVVYEEGGGVRGLNIYVEDDSVYIGGWNDNDDDGGVTTPWSYTYVSSEITTNTPYFAILQFDFDDLAGTGEVRGSLNGVDLGLLPGAGKLFRHTGDIGIGGQSNGACYATGCQGGDNNFFDGHIAEFVSGTVVFNTAQLKLVHNYLAAKYNIALPPADDLYDYEIGHGYEVFGIGQDNASNSHYISQGSGIVRIENPSSAANGRYLLIGHDGTAVSAWRDNSETDIPNNDANTRRLNRVWRVDKQGGDIGSITVRLDTTSLPLMTFGYSKYVLITDADGDFTSGSAVYELVPDGGEYHGVDNINFSKGDYFTIGIVRPTVQFTTVASDDDEPVTDGDPALPEFEVRLNYITQSDITVDYATSDVTAVAGNDYTSASGTLTLSAGDSSSILHVDIINDTDVESDETFNITLSNPTTGIQVGTNSTHTFTIHDDDNPRKIEFTITNSAGDESVSPVSVEVSINISDISNDTEVDYTITGGTATEGVGNDYVLADGTVTITSGSFNQNLPPITLNDDAIDEADETFIITLSNPVNANLGTNTTYTYTIQDNDAGPTVQMSTTTTAGAESYNPGQIEIILSAVSGQDITIDYAASDNTAVGGGIDYNLPNGTLTIPAGEDTVYIDIEIFNDVIEESTEDFTVTISNPVNAVLGANTVNTYAIYDDDGLGYIGPGGIGDETQYKIWLNTEKESMADGASVATFTDQSGNGNDGTAAGSAQPTFESDAGNSVNGRAVVRFDGTDDLLQFADDADINTSNFTLKTLLVAFRTGADVTSRQLIWEQGGGTNGLNIYIDNGSLYMGAYTNNGPAWGNRYINTGIAANTEYYALLEFDEPNTTFKGYLNGTQLATVHNDVGVLQSHSGDIGMGAINQTTKFHDGNQASGYNFNGDVMEFVSYNYKINDAQKKILQNYFAAKYQNNIDTSIPDDLYDYESTHDWEVFGIGQEDVTNTHIISQGTGIIRIDQPNNLNNGEYLIVGHDNADITTWRTDSIPYDSIQRVLRTWIADESGGDLGTVRIGVDTTVLPVKLNNYYSYVVMVDEDNDGDGKMSTTVSDVRIYPMNSRSGAMRLATVTLNDGEIFTIGIARNRTVQDGNWNNTSTWLLQQLPQAGEVAIISDGHTIDVTADVDVGAVEIGSGAILNLNSYEFTLNTGDFTNNGTINTETSTVNYAAAGAQCIEPLTYYSLTVSGTGTKTLCGDIVVTNDILIFGTPATLTLDADVYDIELQGDWNSTATFNPGNATVSLTGSGDQIIDRNSGTETFNVLDVQTAGTLNMGCHVSVASDLQMNGGNINTSTYKIIIGTGAGATGNITQNSGYIIGNLERWIDDNSLYEYPFGTVANELTTTIQFSNVTSAGSVLLGFDTNLPGNNGLPLDEDGLRVASTFTEGFWTLTEVNSITYTGGFDVELTANGFVSNSIGAGTRVVTRPNSFTDWDVEGTHVNATGNTVRRDGLTTLNAHLAIADTTDCVPVTSAITGDNSVCVNETGVVYSVTNTPGSSYTWVVTGGTIISGNGSNSITVDWGATAGPGNVRVTEDNGCSVGAPVDLPVTINDLPTITFSHPDVCINSGLQALSATPAGGTFSGTGVSGNNFDPGVAGVGTHTITYSYTDGNGCANSANDDIEVFALPTVAFTAPADVCLNAGLQPLSGTPAGGTFSGTGVSGTNFDPSAAGAGTHNITYSYTDGNGCTNSANDDIEVFALPTVTFTAPADVCIDAGLQPLSGTPAGGSYSGTGVSGTNFDPATAGAGTHNITYSYTDGNGCTNSANDDIEVFALPTVTFTAPADVCLNAGLQPLNGTPAGGSFSGTGVSGTNFDPSAAGAGTHNITYSYTDGNGCTNSANDDIEVFALPTVTFTAPGDVCIDAGLQPLSGTPAGGSFSGTGVSGTNFDPATAGAGTHNITYSYTDGNGCTNSANDDIEVFALPTVTFTAPADVCLNAGLQPLNGTPAGGSFSGTGVSGTNFNPAVAGVGTHNITYSYTDGNGCTDSANDNIEVFNVPNPSVSGDVEACERTTHTYSTPATGNDFLWTVSGGTIVSGQGTNEITVTWNNLVPVGTLSAVLTVEVEETITATSCDAVSTLNVTVYRTPETGPSYHIENDFNN